MNLRSFSLYSDHSYPLRRTLLKLNFKGPNSSSEREIKFRRWLFTSSIKREIRHFHVVSRAKTGKKCTKKCDAHAKLLFCLLNILFLTFLLCPCRWILKSLLSNHYTGIAMSFDTKLHFWWRRHYRIRLDSLLYLAWFMASINTTVCWSSLF